jgi:hypothetical protein
MDNLEVADVRAVRFWTKYVENPDGTMREVDWVEYARKGDAKYQITPEAIKRLPPAVMRAVASEYNAWKAGKAPVLNGTPLDVWTGLDAGQIEVLRSRDVRTLEDLASLTDGQAERVPLPGMLHLRQGAKRFLDARSGAKVENELARKDAEIEALKLKMEELAALVQGRDHDEEPVKRRPGRPRREADDAEAA